MPERRPLQARSRANLDRITASARKLLALHSFDDITIRDIVRDAGTSIGAFYNRFSGKRALLEYLDVRQTATALTLWTAFFDRPRWQTAPPAEIVHAFVAAAVRAHRQSAGLLRATYFRLRSGDDPDFRTRARRVDQLIRRRLTERLLAHRGRLAHPAPERAIPFALLVTASAIREAVLFEDLRLNPAELGDEQLTDELARAFCAYVGCSVHGHGGKGAHGE